MIIDEMRCLSDHTFHLSITDAMREGRKVILLVVGALEQKRYDVRTTAILSQK